METCIGSIYFLHNGLSNLLRLFQEARGYKDLQVKTNEKSFTMPLMSRDKFLNWIITHKEPMMNSLRILGTNSDSTKTIRADFLLTELPFKNKDIGVKQLRETLENIKIAHLEDKISISTSYMGTQLIYLPREMEMTLIYKTNLTPDAGKYLAQFKKKYRRLTIVELSINNHLRSYLLDHPYMPKKIRRLNKKESKKHIPQEPIRCNELLETSIEVLLVGGVSGDIVESTTALKNGINLVQYWKIIPDLKKCHEH